MRLINQSIDHMCCYYSINSRHFASHQLTCTAQYRGTWYYPETLAAGRRARGPAPVASRPGPRWRSSCSQHDGRSCSWLAEQRAGPARRRAPCRRRNPCFSSCSWQWGPSFGGSENLAAPRFLFGSLEEKKHVKSTDEFSFKNLINFESSYPKKLTEIERFKPSNVERMGKAKIRRTESAIFNRRDKKNSRFSHVSPVTWLDFNSNVSFSDKIAVIRTGARKAVLPSIASITPLNLNFRTAPSLMDGLFDWSIGWLIVWLIN